MKKLLLLVLLSIVLTSCATHQAYDTAAFRNRDYNTDGIALTPGGLTAEQVAAISATRPPTQFPLDVSLIVIQDGYISSSTEQILVANMIEALKASDKISRITPVPRFLVPANLNFGAIQELGIRTMSEYVIVLVMDESSLFKWTKILSSRYEIHSGIEILVVDSYSGAIVASDKLYSTQIYNQDLFKTGERAKAQQTIFSEQGQLLGSRLDTFFTGGGE